ncbi:MAG TPA: hypothetical protein VMW19_20590 [Myxococcota bacterium]|nr:hypothetical protein [Myxococcota bacterium]
MAKPTKGTPEPEAEALVPGSDAPVERPPLPKPIGMVRRTLVRPDGTKVAVDVPVYPPFRLESGETPPATKPPRRKRPEVKRPTGSD